MSGVNTAVDSKDTEQLKLLLAGFIEGPIDEETINLYMNTLVTYKDENSGTALDLNMIIQTVQSKYRSTLVLFEIHVFFFEPYYVMFI